MNKRIQVGSDGKMFCPKCKGNIARSSDGYACMHCGMQDLCLPKNVKVRVDHAQRQAVVRERALLDERNEFYMIPVEEMDTEMYPKPLHTMMRATSKAQSRTRAVGMNQRSHTGMTSIVTSGRLVDATAGVR